MLVDEQSLDSLRIKVLKAFHHFTEFRRSADVTMLVTMIDTP